jgi:hypothetical protein
MSDLYDEIMDADEDPFETLRDSETADTIVEVPDEMNIEELDMVHFGLYCEILSEDS